MRKNVKNEKVLRAMAVGIATMIAVTSTPVAVLAEDEPADPVKNENENVPEGEDGGSSDPTGEQETQLPTVQEVANLAAGTASAAEDYTGTLDENATPAEGTGTIGKAVALTLNVIANGETAVEAGNTLYDTAESVETAVNNLASDGKPSTNGLHQIPNSESMELAQEETFGVQLNKETGAVVDQDGLNKKVATANGLTQDAEDEKKGVYEALNGENGVGKAIETANGLINDAKTKKNTADQDTSTANTAAAGKAGIDSATQSKLDDIASTLEAAVTTQDPETAVGAAEDASKTAVQVCNEKLQIAEQAYQQAKSAADEAQTHSSDYTITQLTSLAGAAQSAADSAKKAADLADQAVEVAEQQEKKAQTAVNNAKAALEQAQREAVAVLKDYQDKIKAINATISTANDSRLIAQKAMKDANDAIDAAILLMGSVSDTSATGVQEKIKAMNEAIEKANTAIKGVTGLVYDESVKERYYQAGISKEEREKLKAILESNAFYNAEKRCRAYTMLIAATSLSACNTTIPVVSQGISSSNFSRTSDCGVIG